jgi:protein-S-isoprenylcysteine O-methyltransferase Ste14
MKLTKLSAAWLQGWTCRLMPAPPRSHAGTASQLIPGVGRHEAIGRRLTTGMASAQAWWKGSRGEWYVVVQLLLVVLILVGPRRWRGWPGWPFPEGPLVSVVGVALLFAGAGLAIAGIVNLGAALTPLPYPGAGAVLREKGVYAVVRHPMYSGVLLAALGWALVREGWLTFGYVGAAWLFIEAKVRREEKWLIERFPTYTHYRRRVRKLIPFVY